MEKKNKRKFWGTLSSYLLTFMFISSWAVLGIALALTSANVNLGGSITFQATDVQATVSAATFTGLKDASAVTGKCQGFTVNASTKTAPAEAATWAGLVLAFADDAGDVTITYTITNNDTANGMVATFGTLVTTGINATMTVTAANDTAAAETVASSKAYTVASGKVLTITVTFKVTDANLAASVNGFSVPLTLTRAAA